jgi:putative sterol carrier protein
MSEQISTPGEAPVEAETTGTNGASAEAASAPVATEAPAAAETPTAGAETPTAEVGGASTADLVGLIEGKSDEEIVELIKALGEDSFFAGLFDEMAKRFLPDKAAGKTAVIEYDINMPDGTKTFQLDIAAGTCTISQDAPKDASVTLILSAPDFLRLISGKLNGMSAFMSGKLKLKGDMMLAQTMQGWFDAS